MDVTVQTEGTQSPSQQECPSQGGTLIVGSHKTRTENDSLCFMEYVRNLTERTLKESKDLAGRGEERAFWAGGTGCAGEQRWVESVTWACQAPREAEGLDHSLDGDHANP